MNDKLFLFRLDGLQLDLVGLLSSVFDSGNRALPHRRSSRRRAHHTVRYVHGSAVQVLKMKLESVQGMG